VLEETYSSFLESFVGRKLIKYIPWDITLLFIYSGNLKMPENLICSEKGHIFLEIITKTFILLTFFQMLSQSRYNKFIASTMLAIETMKYGHSHILSTDRLIKSLIYTFSIKQLFV
jgi:hypothetical protein